MSRVQCLECGIAVVVDPSGLCPEGHVVGSAGARIENAMGMAAPHPDEPEPWVATVELDQSDEPQTQAAQVRAVRPVQIVDAGETAGDPVAGGAAEAADHEALMRELHALGDLDETPQTSAAPSRGLRSAPPAATHSTSPAAAESAPNMPERPTAAPEHQVTRDEMAEGFAELSALEAAVQALEFERTPDEPVAAPPTETPATDAGSELDDLSALFAAEVASQPAAVVDAPVTDGRSQDDQAAGADEREEPTSGFAAPEPLAEPATRAADEPPAAPSREPVRESARQLDITNFTARGGTVGAGRGGGRRKLFGR